MISRVACSHARGTPPRYRALDAPARAHLSHVGQLEPDSYVTIQNHPRLGALLLEPFFFLRQAYRPRGPSPRTMGRIGLSLRHQRMLHPAGGENPFDRRRLRCHSHPRSLKPRRRNTIALRIIQVAAGTQFDPELVAAIEACSRFYPRLRACRANDTRLFRFTLNILEAPPWFCLLVLTTRVLMSLE